MIFDAVQRIADAVLYEGYLLYPYRATSAKNRVRFQFGVVAPRDHALAEGSEHWEQQTELPIAPLRDAHGRVTDPTVVIRVRSLQLQGRATEVVDPTSPDGFRAVPRIVVGGEELIPWDEAVEAVVDLPPIGLSATDVRSGAHPSATLGGSRDVEHLHDEGSISGRIVRVRWPLEGVVRWTSDPLDGVIRLRVRVENLTPVEARPTGWRRGTWRCATRCSVATRCWPSRTVRSCR